MDMTKSDVCQFLTQGTKNAHCTTCAFIPYAGFSQIRSHIISSHMYSTNARVTLNCMYNVWTSSGLSVDCVCVKFWRFLVVVKADRQTSKFSNYMV